MKLVASMSTQPQRRETFETVVDCILRRQSRPIDRLIVHLYKYGTDVTGLPEDPRIEYRQDSRGAGPWVRYEPAGELDPEDALLTLDDDTFYPEDYVEKGVSALERAGDGWAVTFGGILWDPLADDHSYTENSWRFLAPSSQGRDRTVAFHMGLVSFFRARDVQGIVAHPLPGFNTNDDMMIAWGLQKRGISIRCLARPADWIRDLPTATAAHALYRWDVDTRYRTFRDMVEKLGFDPTVGELERYRARPRRVLVLADTMPPLPGSEELDRQLRELCAIDTGVHLLGPVPGSRVPDVMFRMDAPYEVHAIAVPERGGRLDWFAPVRAWRNGRVARESARKRERRERVARQRLAPTEILRFRNGILTPEASV